MTSCRSADTPIDPRFRARRRDIRRHQGRRRLRRLGGVALVACLAVAGGLAVLSPVLDVDRVEVRGTSRTGPDEVRRAAGIEPGDPMVTVRSGRAGGAVESLPWVARATVAREWPATVVVSVEERQAAAVADAGGGRRVLVDPQGRQLAVLAPGEDPGPRLPSLSGPPFDPAPGQSLASWAGGALDAARRLQVGFDGATVHVAVLDGGLVEARLQGAGAGDLVVRFGEPDRLEDKVQALLSVLAAAGPAPAVVDVRAPNAPALTRARPDPILSTATLG